ncbi:MAG: glycyl-radical enzyme activating protein [Draconibacterium sp.]|nr:glycyl-radical enzyme activating protein [Draconibacterium sp.]
MIFNIQRYSTHDGEGIRTLIFYKGCPLQCWWCSNPESQSFGYSLMYDGKSCKNFGDCVKANPAITNNGNRVNIDRESLTQIDKLKNTCASKALIVSGEMRSVSELLFEIEKDKIFYKKNGGVTLSGGEPLAQNGELVDLLEELNQQEINTNVETTLHVNWDKIERTFGLIDTYLVDVKHVDAAKFKKYTNGDLKLFKANLEKLTLTDANIIARVPVIPEFNHSDKDISDIIDYISEFPTISEIHFLPYHTFGTEKYKMLDMDYALQGIQPVKSSEIKPYLKYAKSKGFKTKIGG